MQSALNDGKRYGKEAAEEQATVTIAGFLCVCEPTHQGRDCCLSVVEYYWLQLFRGRLRRGKAEIKTVCRRLVSPESSLSQNHA